MELGSCELGTWGSGEPGVWSWELGRWGGEELGNWELGSWEWTVVVVVVVVVGGEGLPQVSERRRTTYIVDRAGCPPEPP